MFAKLRQIKLPARLSFLRTAPAFLVLQGLLLALCAAVLNVWLNARFPIPTSVSSHFLLAVEVPVAFAFVALLRRVKVRLPFWCFVLVGVVALLCRLFMAADNISHRYLYRDFRVPLDVHLVPEFFRLMYDTSPVRALVSYAALLILFCLASVFIVAAVLSYVHRSSERVGFRRLVMGFLLLCTAAIAGQELGGPTLYTRETAHRIGQEIENFAKLPEDRKKILKSITDVGERIGPGTWFDKLQGNNVLFFFIESYGRTAFVQPRLRELLVPYHEEMAKNLEAEGFVVASDFLTSPTYGGFSWFAHNTLATGVKIISHLHSQLLDEQDPKSFADRFRDAGYLPIFVAPATTRPWPRMDDYYGFRNHYYSWEFGYRGPKYGWAPMADQFAVYHVHRTEVEKQKQPLFIEFALISSHAPFNDIPKYVDDWSTIGNGAILFSAGRDRFDTGWSNPVQIHEGYAAAIKYEMRVIEGYLTNLVKDDTLVIFVGDHQPHQQVTGPNNLTWSVPIHIASRNPEFVAPFLRRGYIRGMVPDQPLPHVGLERFMEEFLSDFSTQPLAVPPGIWPPIAKRLQAKEATLR